jgi:hypothetical protein
MSSPMNGSIFYFSNKKIFDYVASSLCLPDAAKAEAILVI